MRTFLMALMVFVLSACARASGPDGLYLMTRFAFGNLEMATYHFSDGTVVRNPTGTAGGIDAAAERSRRPNDVGTYAMAGDQLTLSLGKYVTKSQFQPSEKGCFGYDGGIWCPATAFAADQRLQGKYEGGASVGGGAVMSSTSIQFHDDGRYELSGVASLSSTGERTGASASAQGQERGTYRIDGTSLQLTPEGGAPRNYSTFPYDDGSVGPAPRRIYFAGGMLKRVQ